MESPTKTLRERFRELSVNTPPTTAHPSVDRLSGKPWNNINNNNCEEDKENLMMEAALNGSEDTVIHDEDADLTEPQWLKVKNALKVQERVVSSLSGQLSADSDNEDEDGLEDVLSNTTWERMKKIYATDDTVQSVAHEQTFDLGIQDYHQIPEYSFEDKNLFSDFSNPNTHKVMSFQSNFYADSPMPKPQLVRPRLVTRDVPEKPPVEIRLITPLDEGMFFEDGAWVYPTTLPRPMLGSGRYELNISGDDYSVNITTMDAAHVTNVSHLDLSYSESQRHLISILNDAISPGSDWDKVTTVDISSKNVVTLKGLEQFLPKLKELNLSSNMITTLDGLPSGLQSLSLANNGITDQVLNFSKFQNLHTLDLSGNQITNIHQFQNLKNLRKLVLSGNRVKTLADLPVVQHLVVSNNFIRGSIDLSLYNFTEMMQLDLSGNKITGVTNFDLSQLRVMNLSNNNNLSKLLFAPSLPNLKKLELVGCTKLKEFDCGNNLNNLRLLTLASDTVITGVFPHLESLTLSGVHCLERLQDYKFTVNKHLLELRLFDGGITLDDLGKIQKLFEHVKFFNLSGNAIDGSFEEMVTFFQGYKGLCSLNLDDNPLKENIKDPELMELFQLMLYRLTHK